jgi:hypothetical protein
MEVVHPRLYPNRYETQCRTRKGNCMYFLANSGVIWMIRPDYNGRRSLIVVLIQCVSPNCCCNYQCSLYILLPLLTPSGNHILIGECHTKHETRNLVSLPRQDMRDLRSSQQRSFNISSQFYLSLKQWVASFEKCCGYPPDCKLYGAEHYSRGH